MGNEFGPERGNLKWTKRGNHREWDNPCDKVQIKEFNSMPVLCAKRKMSRQSNDRRWGTLKGQPKDAKRTKNGRCKGQFGQERICSKKWLIKSCYKSNPNSSGRKWADSCRRKKLYDSPCARMSQFDSTNFLISSPKFQFLNFLKF